MGVYVCFDDSDSNPTYSPASSAYLVEGDSANGGNPCSLQNSGKVVSVMPQTFEEIRDFADFMGWDAGMDAMGNVVLYTNIKK